MSSSMSPAVALQVLELLAVPDDTELGRRTAVAFREIHEVLDAAVRTLDAVRGHIAPIAEKGAEEPGEDGYDERDTEWAVWELATALLGIIDGDPAGGAK